jgi:hypothetical protein
LQVALTETDGKGLSCDTREQDRTQSNYESQQFQDYVPDVFFFYFHIRWSPDLPTLHNELILMENESCMKIPLSVVLDLLNQDYHFIPLNNIIEYYM